MERLESQELEEGEQNPVVFEESPFFTCDLPSLTKISFGVADNMYGKSERSKYFPEVVVISPKGKILTRVNPEHLVSDKYGLEYISDCREVKMKLNDDKKVKISLQRLAKKGRMVLFTVRGEDLRAKPPKEGEFANAWFRLNNEETNQTIDYTKLSSIEKPEGFEEDPPLEEGVDIGEQPRNEIVYLAGRVYVADSGVWVYESLNQCMTSDKFEDPIQVINELY